MSYIPAQGRTGIEIQCDVSMETLCRQSWRGPELSFTFISLAPMTLSASNQGVTLTADKELTHPCRVAVSTLSQAVQATEGKFAHARP